MVFSFSHKFFSTCFDCALRFGAGRGGQPFLLASSFTQRVSPSGHSCATRPLPPSLRNTNVRRYGGLCSNQGVYLLIPSLPFLLTPHPIGVRRNTAPISLLALEFASPVSFRLAVISFPLFFKTWHCEVYLFFIASRSLMNHGKQGVGCE